MTKFNSNPRITQSNYAVENWFSAIKRSLRIELFNETIKRIYQNRELLTQSKENQKDEEENTEVQENNEENNKKN